MRVCYVGADLQTISQKNRAHSNECCVGRLEQPREIHYVRARADRWKIGGNPYPAPCILSFESCV
jgi:hypothetical protein